MTRRSLLAAAGVLVAIQGGLIVAYRSLGRSDKPSVFRAERIALAAPSPLAIESAPGALAHLPSGRPVLVHFWATWCAPCRKELPGLLQRVDELERSHDLQLVAIAIDDDWPAISRFFGGKVPEGIVRATEPGAQRRWGTDALPDTYLVDAQGRLRERYRGARDWLGPAAREHLDAAVAKLSEEKTDGMR